MAWSLLGAGVAQAQVTTQAPAAPQASALPPAAWPSDPLVLAGALVAQAGHGGRPFAVVDKRQAELLVFTADGVLAGRSAALLGRARGDASAPGVGQRTQQGRLRDADRTTPAGRFISEPGRNLTGEAVVWVDYDAAFAIHRLRPGADHTSRSRRLAGHDPRARRVSAGCVVVPGRFFDTVVQPLLGRQRGLVLVMPEAAGPPDA